DDYVNNITERLNLYNKLSDLTLRLSSVTEMEEDLQQFEKELEDRFGELPLQVVDLLNSVRVKGIAIKMGLERVAMKHGKFVGYFIADQQSGFYQSDSFTRVLQFVQANSQTVKMKEKQTRSGLRLLLTFDNARSVKQVLEVLGRFEGDNG
ncbi:MAG: transcription-repair coupling factor, partial [Flavobacteriales bacterium]|nr:transcription-repair coupling factor [Flavobacteriales bacterium]